MKLQMYNGIHLDRFDPGSVVAEDMKRDHKIHDIMPRSCAVYNGIHLDKFDPGSVVYNGIHLDKFDPGSVVAEDVKRDHKIQDGPMVLCVGRLTTAKV
ncbi:hypothetical protein T484DRAFT_1781405 [Baffinella frigidus]|nr:hypothetical protein T484DRAFT_1781405 [Cryptophyta sp. CCMP2293]